MRDVCQNSISIAPLGNTLLVYDLAKKRSCAWEENVFMQRIRKNIFFIVVVLCKEHAYIKQPFTKTGKAFTEMGNKKLS